MAERYIRQFDFENGVYSPDCPVVLEKGAVLLDTKTNAYFLQLKFANIGATGIASTRICIVALDSAGQLAYPELSETYNEHTVTGDTFGVKKLLPIQNSRAKMFYVYVEKLTIIDGEIYTFSRERYAPSNQHDIAAIRESIALKYEKQRQSVKVNVEWLILVTISVLFLIFMSLLHRFFFGIFGFGTFVLPIIFTIIVSIKRSSYNVRLLPVKGLAAFLLILPILHIVNPLDVSYNLTAFEYMHLIYLEGSVIRGGIIGAFIGQLLTFVLGRASAISALILAVSVLTVSIVRSFFSAKTQIKNESNKQ